MKKVFAFILIAVVLLSLIGCAKSEAVLKVELMIDSLGTITADSDSAITAAQDAYNALSDKEKKSVSNYAALGEASASYQALLDEIASQNEIAAKIVENMISGLGEIKVGSADAINEALNAYNALSSEQKALVSSTAVNTLSSAVDAWKEKYEFSGFYYTVQTCNVFDSTLTDVTLSKSTYAALYEDSEEVYIKLSDDMDKIIFKNQYGTYFGTVERTSSEGYRLGIFGDDTYLRPSTVNVPCTSYAISWEDIPVILNDKTLTQNKIFLFLKNGSSAGLFEMTFVLDGRSDNGKAGSDRILYPLHGGFSSFSDIMTKNSIAVDYLFEVSSTAH